MVERGRLAGGGTEQKGEGTHGRGLQCGGCRGGGTRGLNGDGENIIKV